MDADNSIFHLPPTAIRTLSKNYNGGRITDDIIRRVEQQISHPLPASYRQWLLAYNDRCLMRYGGNFMTYSLLPGSDPMSLVGAIAELEPDGWPVDPRFIIFGSDGRNGIFSFYTDFEKDAEYPVIMVDGKTAEPDRPYVFVARSFTSFVNTYVHFEHWRSTSEPEELADENLVMRFIDQLCRQFQPGVSAAVLFDLYDPANYLTGKMLELRLKELF